MSSPRKIVRRKLQLASQAEILRSNQRDNDFVKNLSEKLLDLLHRFQGQKFVHIFQSDVPYKLVYFLFTTGMGNQTLGEEYTGIVQAELEAYKVPSLNARILSVLLECFGERTLLKLIEKLQTSINNSPNNELRSEDINRANLYLSKLRTMIPIFLLIHRAFFYIFGRYYSLCRRIVGIDYAKVYGIRSSEGVSWGLRLLGLATLVQSILKIWQCQGIDESDETHLIPQSTNVEGHCRLCLEASPTTATPCGHLFCWNCINDWLRTKPQCPLCREYLAPSRVVRLMNL